MADEADRAPDYNASALAAHFKRVALQVNPSFGHLYCEDCGIKIPAPRRQLVPWCSLCVKCAEIAEKL